MNAFPDTLRTALSFNLSGKLMSNRTCIVLLLASILAVGCRGSDDTDIIEPQFPLTDDPDAFGAFLNPLPGVPRDGVAEGDIDNVQDFPEAYYNTIDPDSTRDTFFKWRLANGFINADGSEAACEPGSCRQTHVKFRDTKDLGYGRNMFMRWNTVTNDIAVYVENFQVDAVPGVPYGPLNFEALVNDDRRWNFGVNAIEFSAYPQTGASDRKFTKFYNFAGDGIRANDVSGTQQHFVDLDNRGDKPMPSACIICHGGHGRTLVYQGADGRKKLAPTLVGGIAGDVQAHLQTIEFDTLQFANEPGFTRADNEAGVQLINEAILFSYEYRQSEFQGDGDWSADLAIATLRGRYAQDPGNPANRYDENFVPAGWSSNQDLYRTIMGPNCLVCHALRGMRTNTSVAFPSLNEFRNYDERVDHLVYEQGKMPLGLLNYSNFWDSDDKDPATMASALNLADRIGADQKAIRPGAPAAVISAPPVATGLDASGASLPIAITGSGSAFARDDGQQWSVSPAESAVVESAGPSGDAILRVTEARTYELTLTVQGIHGGSDSTTQEIDVRSATDSDAPLPGDAIRFFGTGGINELLVANCTSCHSPGGGFSSLPIHYTACNSDEFNGNEFVYRSVLARVNFASPMDSLFLRKPSNGSTDPVNRVASQISGYHAGSLVLTDDADYSRILSWILNGAPAGSIPPASNIDPAAPSCT
ncbi:MAG: hypothetical protein HKN42_13270 [Granulosicoccus sp.]|nr:hypothetical protein [Granulosicoccus sp.]